MNIPNFKDLNILVIGDIILDEYAEGKSVRLSQEAPVPVVTDLIYTHTLGGAANVANNLRSLGAGVTLMGVLGTKNSFNWDVVEKLLDDSGVDYTHSVWYDNSRPCTIKSRLLVNGYQVVRVDEESTEPISEGIQQIMLKYVSNNIDNYNAIIFSDYKKGVISDKLVSGICAMNNKNIIVTANIKNKALAGHFDAITMNAQEARNIFGIKDLMDLNSAITDRVLEKSWCYTGNIVITRGEDGINLYNHTNSFTIPGYKVPVADISGAGDTIISIFTLALASGFTAYDSASLANYGASIVVGKPKTSTVTPPELGSFWDRLGYTKNRVMLLLGH